MEYGCLFNKNFRLMVSQMQTSSRFVDEAANA